MTIVGDLVAAILEHVTGAAGLAVWRGIVYNISLSRLRAR